MVRKLACDSVNGSSGNPGTLFEPKQLFSQLPVLVSNDILGLYRGSTWRETLPIPTSAAIDNITVQAAGSGDLPIITALDPVPNGSWTNNGDGTYEYEWTASGLINDGGSNVYVVEINAVTRTASPIASQLRMTEAADAAEAIATAGSAFVEDLGSNQWRATIHPTDGQAPGTLYTYEVIARYHCVDWFAYERAGTLQSVMLVGASFNYGSLAAPVEFSGNRIIVLHASTHGAVIQGGTIQNSLFYGYGNSSCISLTFYADDPGARDFSALNTTFCLSGPDGFYCHTAGTSDWGSGLVDGCKWVNDRRANGSLQGTALNATQIASIAFRSVYVKGYAVGYSYNAGAVDTEITDSVFRQISRLDSAHTTRNNFIQVENRSDPDNVNFRNATCIIGTSGHTIERNLFYGKSTTNALADYRLIARSDGSAGTISKNIFLVDVDGDVVWAAYNYDDGPLFTSDYNVFILVAGTNPLAIAIGRPVTPNISFATYVSETGQDVHSLYVDATALTVQDIFVDPENGNFNWADTATADTIAAYCETYGVGPTTMISGWPNVGTVDEVAVSVAGVGVGAAPMASTAGGDLRMRAAHSSGSALSNTSSSGAFLSSTSGGPRFGTMT